ncbi:hypothetical protein BH10BAC2_BH10BAC2_04250 [soil metagenome]
MNSFFFEDWYVNGISVINYNSYLKLTEDGKMKFVFDAIVAGLKDIAILDKLDISKIDKVVKKIEEKGLDTELLYKTFENKKYVLVITYFSRSMEEECPIFFNLTDKSSDQTKRIQIGSADNDQIYLWLQKVTLTNKLIKVKSSNSIRGQVCLKGKPLIIEFEIDKLMK